MNLDSTTVVTKEKNNLLLVSEDIDHGQYVETHDASKFIGIRTEPINIGAPEEDQR